MWFSKKLPIVFADRNRLTIYQDRPGYPKNINLPTDIVDFLEIYDPRYFNKLLLSFLTPLNLHQDVVLVLSNKITFYTKLNLDDSEVNSSIDSFKSSLPLLEADIAFHTLTRKNLMLLTANNRYYLFTLKKCLELSGCKVKFIVPEIYINLIKSPESFAELSSIVNSNHSLLQQGSLTI